MLARLRPSYRLAITRKNFNMLTCLPRVKRRGTLQTFLHHLKFNMVTHDERVGLKLFNKNLLLFKLKFKQTTQGMWPSRSRQALREHYLGH
jgi:hypothetical protein